MDNRTGKIITAEQAAIIQKELGLKVATEMVSPPTDRQLKRGKVGRNDPCPCGSGQKYKRCHLLPKTGGPTILSSVD